MSTLKEYWELYHTQRVLADAITENLTLEQIDAVARSAQTCKVEFETAFRFQKITVGEYMVLKFRSDELESKIDYVKKLERARREYEVEKLLDDAELFTGDAVVIPEYIMRGGHHKR